jgi:tRNA(Leu) C34 or U34 (ribose-2'-O)-methylase TrmL
LNLSNAVSIVLYEGLRQLKMTEVDRRPWRSIW